MTITVGVSVLVSARTELALFLRERMDEEGITSTRQLGQRIGVSQGTAWRLLNKKVTPSQETLDCIAAAFHVPVTEVREMAERPIGEPDHFQLPREFDQLTEPQRDLLRHFGWEFLRASGKPRVTR